MSDTNEPNQNETKSDQTFYFSEAQVEAAAKAMHETGNPWFAAYGDWGAAGFEIKKAFRESARAALVAAQGAAPQADQEAVDEEQIVASVLAEVEEHRATGDTGGWGTTFHRHGLSNEIHRGVDDCGRGTGKPVYVFDPDFLEEHDEWVVQATLRSVAAAAPVLPSSTIDEDKLAEVLREAEQSWHLSDEKSQQSYACGAPDLKSKYIARAVAEWLKGQGGESRG